MRGLLVCAVLAAAVAAADAGAATTAAPAKRSGEVRAALITRVNVAESEFKFVLNKKTAKRGVVIFKVTNVGAVAHDFMIARRKTRMLEHGQSETLRVTFLRKGHYQYHCTVTGHAAAGMKGVFTIT